MKSHYELLEIDQDANERQIKLAWARLVRKYPADQNPEMNRLLNEAKTCLTDPVAREEYDERLLYGDELSELFDAGREAFSEGDYETAIDSLTELLALAPSRNDARWILAQCYEAEEDFDSAETHYRRLVDREPKRGMFAYGLADMYTKWGAQDEDQYAEAEVWYERATELEPFNAMFHRGHAECLMAQKRYREAERCLRAAIDADGKKDVDDIDTVVLLYLLYLVDNRHSEFNSVARLVGECVRDDPDSAGYAAYKVIEFVRSFVDSAAAWDVASNIIASVRGFCKDLGELEDYAQFVEKRGKAMRQMEKLKEMELEPAIVSAAIQIFALEILTPFSQPREDRIRFTEAIKTWPYVDVMSAWKAAKRSCPELCALVESKVMPFFESSNKSLTSQVPAGPNRVPSSPGGQAQASTTSQQSTSNSGCWTTAIVLGIIWAIVYFANK